MSSFPFLPFLSFSFLPSSLSPSKNSDLSDVLAARNSFAQILEQMKKEKAEN
jgi:hypothetical protein